LNFLSSFSLIIALGLLVDENGEVEKWEVDGKEKLLERIDSEYDRFKTQVMNKFEKPKE
jgi:hypothetical protein